MDLKAMILEKRPIKEKSAEAYVIILRKLNDNQEIENLDYLKNTKEILDKISHLKLTTQRNYIGAVLVGLGLQGNENDESMLFYKKHLIDNLNKSYNEFIESHEKSESQTLNWCSLIELDNIRNQYKKVIRKEKYINKKELTTEEKLYLRDYLIVSLYTLIPPARIDYAPMNIINNIDDDNNESNSLYIKSRNTKSFILNEYKTFKKYGKKIINIPSELNSVINLYLKFNKLTNSFLYNSKGEYMTAKELTLLIPKVFSRYSSKHITLNLLRHIYISENVELKTEEQKKKEQSIANSMCHSVEVQQQYIKK